MYESDVVVYCTYYKCTLLSDVRMIINLLLLCLKFFFFFIWIIRFAKNNIVHARRKLKLGEKVFNNFFLLLGIIIVMVVTDILIVFNDYSIVIIVIIVVVITDILIDFNGPGIMCSFLLIFDICFQT